MKFSNKPSYLTTFLGVFFSVLVILGVIQAITGTIRLYNAHEEQHERLHQPKTYTYTTVDTQEQKNLFLSEKPEETASTYFSSNKGDIEDALKTVPPERLGKINVRVVQAQEQFVPPAVYTPPTQQITIPPIQEQKKIDTFETPVEFRVKPENASAPQGYRTTIMMVVSGNYFRDNLWNFPIIIDTNRVSPRGQMSNQSVTLSSKISSLSEMAKVLVHELAHMIDIYALRQKNFIPDPSKEFYAISWTEPTVVRSNISGSSFVSGYAATNQYEDFAESFTMYVFHNKVFRERAATNKELQKKYDFLRNVVFSDFFLETAYEKDAIPAKLWDVTKIVVKTNTINDVFLVLQSILRTLV